MDKIENANPDQLTYREPCGWGPFIYLPFLLLGFGVGVYFILSPFGLLRQASSNSWVWIVVLFICYMLFKFISEIISEFGRIGVTIDRKKGTFQTAWGLFFPLFEDEKKLEGMKLLAIGQWFKYRGSRIVESKYELFLVRSENDRVKIGRAEHYPAIRAMAEDVGRLLNLNVLDGSTDPAKLLDASTFCKSPLEQAADTSPSPFPSAPAGTSLAHRLEKNRAVFMLPTESNAGCMAGWLLALLAFVGFLIYAYIETDGKALGALAFYAAVLGFPVAIFYTMAAPTTKTIEVDSSKLVIRDKGQFLTSQIEISAQSIREINCKGCLISVVAISKMTSFGSTKIRPEDVQWMRDVIWAVLASPAK